MLKNLWNFIFTVVCWDIFVGHFYLFISCFNHSFSNRFCFTWRYD